MSQFSRFLWLALLLWFLSAGLARAADHAVVLVYHHVDSNTPASTSVSPELFARHLAYLHENGFAVLSLSRLLDDLSHGRQLPEKVVAITFDDAYRSVHRTAMPLLRQYSWPFTVFVNTEPIDRGYGNFMSWHELRELQQNGGQIANHSHTHAYMTRRLPGEEEGAWRQRMRREIEVAQTRLGEKLPGVEKIFAYPYGEFDGPLQAIVRELGFYGIGQQSGAMGAGTDWTAAPRFPMAAGFASLDQFAIKVNSRPLPVEVLAPSERLISADKEAPAMRFRLGDGDFSDERLHCYLSGDKMQLTWLDRGERLIEIRPVTPVGKGRIKYNCTAPSSRQAGVYYWYSHLLIRR